MKRYLLVGLACCGFTTAAQAGFSVDWFTIDGGGGSSTGGVYQVHGTIGQPDAGVLSGGGYTVTGGFWSIAAAVQVPGAPRLLVTRDLGSGAVTVSWLHKPGWILDQTPALTSTILWSPIASGFVTNAGTVSITVPAPASNRFYRLRSQ